MEKENSQNEQNEQNELEIVINFANTLSLDRVKTEGLHFDRDYKRDVEGNIQLVGEKAVIYTHGRTTKVPIGDTHPHQTYAEAEEATTKYWSEYFKERRRLTADKTAKERQRRQRERAKQTRVEQSKRG